MATCSSEKEQALVVYNPDPLLASLHETEHEFRLEWTGTGRSLPDSVKLQQGGRGTGATTWAAGYILATFIAKYHSNMEEKLPRTFVEVVKTRGQEFKFEDRTVVELGAGLGLVSIVLGMLGSRVVSTDGDETVIPFLAKNVRAYRQHMKHVVKVARLHWGSSEDVQLCMSRLPAEGVEGGTTVDIIMAADVVFGQDTRVWEALLATMLKLSHRGTIIFFGYSSRYDLDKKFVESLSEYFLTAEIPSEDWRDTYEQTSVQVMIRK
ncbi:hypothetical protein GUITHDRAFT_141394 [Guillardia theta CCMP2712]|uniref:Uncharacterized protein n=1 Tax=Guillardia theta (strain CCMP2712) TaxID=905079 RepID=L1J0Z3_GUITC|nr:hypothetical protein GUITHDRAFT_141394 [Guillardia theta CCMP2712]EKX42191.1 hypothetical protein GUITHDRAFT_141394 [Guillardia theta CCMP2712]|eukprot:XP_005829171.1 hypothetical protein GUITHDRAFT_141394 [Guillardia theta CCMP2712]